MTEQELTDYLSENLEVEAVVKDNYADKGDGHWRTIEVSLLLKGKVISTSSDEIPIHDEN